MLQKPKFSILLIPSPAVAFGIIELYKFIPEKFSVLAQIGNLENQGEFFGFFKKGYLFGIGLDESLPLNMNSSFMHMALSIGIIGVLLVSITLVFMFYKSGKFIFKKNENAERAKVYAIGLVCSALSFILTTMFTNSLCDFRVSMIFVTIMSLSCISGRCFEADYIDPDMVREHN